MWLELLLSIKLVKLYFHLSKINIYYLANYVDIPQQPLEKPVFVFKPLETEQLLTVSYLSLLKSVARDLLNSVNAGKYHQYCTFQYQLFFKLVSGSSITMCTLCVSH